jgi:hypothetical protein
VERNRETSGVLHRPDTSLKIGEAVASLRLSILPAIKVLEHLSFILGIEVKCHRESFFASWDHHDSEETR